MSVRKNGNENGFECEELYPITKVRQKHFLKLNLIQHATYFACIVNWRE